LTRCPRCGEENPERFRLCGYCGASLHAAQPSQREVRKVVTVLFCDIAGSTPLGEDLDPESMRRLMSRWFALAREVLERHGASVEKFIGDAVMAVFGIPTMHEDDALRAVRAAGELSTALARLNQGLQAEFGVRLQTRTGIDTGEVVAGGPGGRSADAETLVTGDAVNTAARLQQAAAPGEILISRQTRSLVRDAISAQPVAPLALKGKAQPQAAYRLDSVTPGAAAHARRFDSPLVGRDQEVRLLTDAFERAATERSPQLFTLLGAAGVGKSRLLAEVLAHIGARATILRGRCLPYGEGITYWPLRDAIHAVAGVGEGDDTAAVRSKVAALLAGERDADVLTSRLLEAAGLGEEPGPPDEVAWAVRRLFERLARERPLVVVLDDIHWAEPAMLDLIEHVIDWTRDRSVLLVCLARQELLEARPTWGGGKLNATAVLLEPLHRSAADELLGNLLGGTSLPEAVRRRITEAAEGNPLFVEEMVGMLVDDGALTREQGRLVPARDLSDVSVPPSIRALLAARLDRLPSEERTIAERAAVVGRTFERGAVVELAPDEMRLAVPGRIMALVRKELIRPDEPGLAGDETFRFRHLLIRDAAYERLPKEERAELHERFASWLERVAGGRLQEYEEIVGYHLEQAYRYREQLGSVDERARRLGIRASGLLRASGRRALDAVDPHAAVALLVRAESLLPEAHPERGALSLLVANAGWAVGDLELTGAALARAETEAEASGDHHSLWRARLAAAEARLYTDPATRTADVDALGERALAEFRAAGDTVGEGYAWRLIALVSLMHARWDEMRERMLKALACLEGSADSQIKGAMASSVAGACVFGPTPPEDGLRIVADLEPYHRTRVARANADQRRAHLLAFMGRFEEADALIARSTAALRELGLAAEIAGQGLGVGEVRRYQGDLDAAERAYREASEGLEAIGETSIRSTVVALQALMAAELGRYRDALDLTTTAQALGSSDDATTNVYWRASRALALAGLGHLTSAVELAREAVALTDPTDMLLMQGDARAALAAVLHSAGDDEAAAAMAREAIVRFEAKGATAMVERTVERFAAILSA
jgi:class 3 adenylate cyclase/tetratricopeptide (TPR) repeat protein